MTGSTFYPDLISSKMMSRKFHASSSMAYHHKCPLHFTLPYGTIISFHQNSIPSWNAFEEESGTDLFAFSHVNFSREKLLVTFIVFGAILTVLSAIDIHVRAQLQEKNHADRSSGLGFRFEG